MPSGVSSSTRLESAARKWQSWKRTAWCPQFRQCCDQHSSSPCPDGSSARRNQEVRRVEQHLGHDQTRLLAAEHTAGLLDVIAGKAEQPASGRSCPCLTGKDSSAIQPYPRRPAGPWNLGEMAILTLLPWSRCPDPAVWRPPASAAWISPRHWHPGRTSAPRGAPEIEPRVDGLAAIALVRSEARHVIARTWRAAGSNWMDWRRRGFPSFDLVGFFTRLWTCAARGTRLKRSMNLISRRASPAGGRLRLALPSPARAAVEIVNARICGERAAV